MNEIISSICYPLILALVFVTPMINLKLKTLYNRKNFLVYCSIIFLSGFFANWGNISPIVYPIILLSSLCMFYYTYRNMMKSLLLCNVVNIIIIISINITLFFAFKLLNVTSEQVSFNISLKLGISIITLILTFAFSKIVYMIYYKIKDNNKYIFEQNHIKPYSILAVIILLLTVIFFTYLLAVRSSIKFSYNVTALLNGLFSIYLLITFLSLLYSVIELWLDEKYKDTEYSALKKYVSEIEESSYKLRSFKHDYMNILSTLGGYINNNDMDGLSEFFNNNLLPESTKAINSDTHLYMLSHIKIPPIKSLIADKIIKAINNNIKINIEIADDITSIPVNLIDLTRILGVFLDNAIEASVLCDNKFIQFAAITTDTEIIFVIINSCPPDTPPVYKLYEDGFSTKGGGHGLGLNSIKKLIDENYSNILLNTNVKSGIFKQELRISK